MQIRKMQLLNSNDNILQNRLQFLQPTCFYLLFYHFLDRAYLFRFNTAVLNNPIENAGRKMVKLISFVNKKYEPTTLNNPKNRKTKTSPKPL